MIAVTKELPVTQTVIASRYGPLRGKKARATRRRGSNCFW